MAQLELLEEIEDVDFAEEEDAVQILSNRRLSEVRKTSFFKKPFF